MSRALAIAITSVVLVAGCGGGGGSKSSPASTSASTPAVHTVTSRDRSFATVIPTGLTDATHTAQGSALRVLYLAIGPRSQGFATNINVVREPSRGLTDAGAIAAFEVTAIKRIERRARGFSPLQPLTVGGAPARSVDYLNTPAGTRELHQRQVFVQHGGSIYTITYTALPASYAASAGAMDAVLKNWVWR